MWVAGLGQRALQLPLLPLHLLLLLLPLLLPLLLLPYPHQLEVQQAAHVVWVVQGRFPRSSPQGV